MFCLIPGKWLGWDQCTELKMELQHKHRSASITQRKRCADSPRKKTKMLGLRSKQGFQDWHLLPNGSLVSDEFKQWLERGKSAGVWEAQELKQKSRQTEAARHCQAINPSLGFLGRFLSVLDLKGKRWWNIHHKARLEWLCQSAECCWNKQQFQG